MPIPADPANELPNLASARDALRASLWDRPHLPAAVLELCRLRLAQLHGSEQDAAFEERAVPSEQRAALRTWNSSSLFGDAERACLSFAEIYAMDASALTDAQAEAVKSHYGDAGLVALIEALGVFDGAIRINLLWGTVDGW